MELRSRITHDQARFGANPNTAKMGVWNKKKPKWIPPARSPLVVMANNKTSLLPPKKRPSARALEITSFFFLARYHFSPRGAGHCSMNKLFPLLNPPPPPSLLFWLVVMFVCVFFPLLLHYCFAVWSFERRLTEALAFWNHSFGPSPMVFLLSSGSSRFPHDSEVKWLIQVRSSEAGLCSVCRFLYRSFLCFVRFEVQLKPTWSYFDIFSLTFFSLKYFPFSCDIFLLLIQLYEMGFSLEDFRHEPII